MLKIRTSDGQTASVDLGDEEGAAHWLKQLADPSFQRKITSIGIDGYHEGTGHCDECGNAVSVPFRVGYNFSRPGGLDNVTFHAEHVPQSGRVKGGERLIIFAGDVRLTAMSHARAPAVRVALVRVGKRQYNPYENGPKR